MLGERQWLDSPVTLVEVRIGEMIWRTMLQRGESVDEARRRLRDEASRGFHAVG